MATATKNKKRFNVNVEEAKKSFSKLIQSGVPVAKAARSVGIGVRTGYTWRTEVNNKLAEGGKPTLGQVHTESGSLATDRHILSLQGEIRLLKNALRAAHKEVLNMEAIKELIGIAISTEPEVPTWTIKSTAKSSKKNAAVPVTIWSDWHGGEVVSLTENNGLNEYNPAIMEKRVQRLVSSTINLCKNHGPGNYPGIVINLLGDFVSGGLHPELLKTDSEEIMPSALRVRDILIWAIDTMQDHFGKLYMPCISGNHGRLTQKPEYKRYVYKNADWLIYQMLLRHYQGAKNGKNIVFKVPDSNEALYSVYGHRFFAMHGDMLGTSGGGEALIGSLGKIARGELKVGKQAGLSGLDYDTLLIGHFHQPLWLPRVVVANSLKGPDEYSKNVLRAVPTTPSQPLFFVTPEYGITSRWEVFVEDVKQYNQEWIAWTKSGD